MTNTGIPSQAQQRREVRERQEEARRTGYINAQVRGPAAMAARLFPGDNGIPDRVRSAVGARYDATPHDPGASIAQIAVHEAGHYAVAEACGLVATTAEIHGSPFGRGGWGGTAAAFERRVVDGGRWGFTAEDVEREAMFTFGGVVAERIFDIIGPPPDEPSKRGDLYGSLGELMEGCILAAQLADMRNEGRSAALDSVLKRTAQSVVAYGDQVEQIAGCLKSRRRIFRDDRKVSKFLESIRRSPLKRLIPFTPEQAVAVRSIITDAPTNLIRFVEEIGR